MPNYLANRWFNSVSEMSAFVVDSTDEDGLGPFIVRTDDTTFKFVVWRKNSVETIDNDVIFAANGPGRWVALELTGSNTVLSNNEPTTVLPSGTTYVWTENGAVNTYDSVISYISNGTVWIELDARVRLHTDTPASLSKTPNSDRETWRDTTTGILYHAFSGGWVAGEGAS